MTRAQRQVLAGLASACLAAVLTGPAAAADGLLRTPTGTPSAASVPAPSVGDLGSVVSTVKETTSASSPSIASPAPASTNEPTASGTSTAKDSAAALAPVTRTIEAAAPVTKAVDSTVATITKAADDTVAPVKKTVDDTVATIAKTADDTVAPITKTVDDTLATVTKVADDTVAPVRKMTDAAPPTLTDGAPAVRTVDEVARLAHGALDAASGPSATEAAATSVGALPVPGPTPVTPSPELSSSATPPGGSERRTAPSVAGGGDQTAAGHDPAVSPPAPLLGRPGAPVATRAAPADARPGGPLESAFSVASGFAGAAASSLVLLLAVALFPLALAAPALGRIVRLSAALLRPPALAYSLERPG